jgi:hypothetical protein
MTDFTTLPTKTSAPVRLPGGGTDSTSIQAIDEDLLLIVPPRDTGVAVVSRRFDLPVATVGGNPVAPAWSDPELVISASGLGLLRETTKRILSEVYGPSATLTPTIEHDPDSGSPMLVFYIGIRRDQRTLRSGFHDRYVRETEIPENAPVPVLAWKY